MILNIKGQHRKVLSNDRLFGIMATSDYSKTTTGHPNLVKVTANYNYIRLMLFFLFFTF